MHETKKTHIPGKYILLLLTAICIAMIIASYFFDTTRGPVRTIVGYVTTPIQKCLTIAGDWVEDRFSYFRDKQDLISENERLQEQVETLTLRLQEQKMTLQTVSVYSNYTNLMQCINNIRK